MYSEHRSKQGIFAEHGFINVNYPPVKAKRYCNFPLFHGIMRKENLPGSAYNLVGFQTNLKFGEQKRVFSMIPALKNAEFLRYGVMHRNTFINSPKLLKATYEMREREGLFFAGQITGVEGYMESASSGIIAGINAANKILGKDEFVPSALTMIGALARYISNEEVESFQPMGANFGALPPLDEKIRDKKLRYEALAERGLKEYEGKD